MIIRRALFWTGLDAVATRQGHKGTDKGKEGYCRRLGESGDRGILIAPVTRLAFGIEDGRKGIVM